MQKTQYFIIILFLTYYTQNNICNKIINSTELINLIEKDTVFEFNFNYYVNCKYVFKNDFNFNLLLISLKWQIKNPTSKNTPVNKILNIQFNLFKTYIFAQTNIAPNQSRTIRLQKKLRRFILKSVLYTIVAQTEIEREKDLILISYIYLNWLLFAIRARWKICTQSSRGKEKYFL